jgi:hypothetical protein
LFMALDDSTADFFIIIFIMVDIFWTPSDYMI